MTVNSSASSSVSLLLSSLPTGLYCLMVEPYSSVIITYTITNILCLLPFCILVFYHGLQRWRQQRSSSTAEINTHLDSFTYHLVTMEMISISGWVLCVCGIVGKDFLLINVGYYLYSVTWYGETFFHVLTCVQHYLAVVHPITYLSLRKHKGIRIRSITIGCIWLLSFGGMSLVTIENISKSINLCLLPLSLIIISYCSLSVLCVLIHPGPAEQGQDRDRVHRSKQRAFYTIVAILGVLLVRCSWYILWNVLSMFESEINQCVVITGHVWFNLPSSLVLPLLFLQNTGTLACCRTNIK